MSDLPPRDDALLTRDETAEALTRAGYRIRRSTLATMAVRQTGPPYLVFGRTPVYRWKTTLLWAENRLAQPRRQQQEVAA